MNPEFSSIGIIGLGHIGASLALAIKREGLAETLYGFDRSEENLRFCRAEDMIDAVVPLEKMAQECDLIIIATPPHAVAEMTEKLRPHLGKHTVITDVASVKLPVLRYLEQPGNESLPFIPGHPIAGGTHPGPGRAHADLFTRKMVMLTPPLGIEMDNKPLQVVMSFWRRLEAVVELIPADFHDLVYAYVSHLPHLVAYAACATLVVESELKDEKGLLKRFTRLGHSHPPLWADIVLNNQPNVLLALKNYLAMVSHIRSELSQGAKDEPVPQDCTLAASVLFPRVAASCLVASVSMLEKQSGQRMVRYSGAGFVDAACPAIEAPEGEIEQISNHAKAVSEILLRFEKHLDMLCIALEANQPKQLTQLLHEMHNAHAALKL